MSNYLIVGAAGQLGIELMLALQQRHGPEQVVLADIRPVDHPDATLSTFVHCDATDKTALADLVDQAQPAEMYMLVAMLSAKGEASPLQAWGLNMDPLLHALELAKDGRVAKVFWPSSIAVFGPDAPKDATPQDTGLRPTTVYGVSKVSGELWCQYYHQKYGVDVRSLRYPGLIGFRSQPGGGTTDYAVEAFHAAVEGRPLHCYLEADETLPMMTMEDAVCATLELMAADGDALSVRTSYNLQGCSFSPAELVAELRAQGVSLDVLYAPDTRQDIAASWPNSLDDAAARNDWGWKSAHDTSGLVRATLAGLSQPAVG